MVDFSYRSSFRTKLVAFRSQRGTLFVSIQNKNDPILFDDHANKKENGVKTGGLFRNWGFSIAPSLAFRREKKYLIWIIL